MLTFSKSAGYFAARVVFVIMLTAILQLHSAFAQELDEEKTSSELVQEIFQDAQGNAGLKARYERLVTNPISPPDTRSPRATLESFLVIMQTASELWLEVRDSYFDGDTFFMTRAQRDQLVLVQSLLEKAARTFDLSAIPAASRQRASIETVLQLQEVFDRIYLPPVDEIPGLAAGAFVLSDSEEGTLPAKWIIPGTSLTIARQKEGPREGEYLFAQGTINQIADDYEEVKALPMIADSGEDLYQYYIYTPGNLVAPHWYEFILEGPYWLRYQFGNQAYWQWLGLGLIVVISMAGLISYSRWNARRAVPLDPARRQTRRIVAPLLIIVMANIIRFLIEEQINITGDLLQITTAALSAVIWTVSAWFTYQLLQILYMWTIRNPALSNATLDASLLRTGFQVMSFIVAIVVLGYGATQIGIPIYGVVAGLGVGGLAIALAAQPTLENFISGVLLYADRIVRVGDFFQFDDTAGTVEEIGIRSTRIRALDRTLIIVANADLVKRKITNYSRRDVFLFRHKIGLRYQTDADTLNRVMEDMRALLSSHDSVLEAPQRVRLVEYGESAVLIDIYANISSSDINVFLEVQEELLLAIRDIVERNGSSFAYPSSTLYLARDNYGEHKPDTAVLPNEKQDTKDAPPAGNES
ncbi:mechanosensitive ion channel family protein [Martelella soudanensis]|uniref:mechanosensitive ion channel family protein n=1 Tax=unclassified Martelella TaxID=2629616 RepID=UPI0015DF1836|nr:MULTISPECIES: mechanosensitive ion channel family protein [unclassified Martelella]